MKNTEHHRSSKETHELTQPENKNKCSACQYFLQHYGLNEKKLFRVYCGHCTFSRARHRNPDAAACRNFTPGPAATDAFVTREYLSKELLQYILSLQLLPEIQERRST